MIPFATCLCFGKQALSSWRSASSNTTLVPAGSTLPITETTDVSCQTSDKDMIYVGTLGGERVKCKHKEGGDHKNRFDLDLKDIEGASRCQGRIGLKFLSLHKIRRKRRPVLKFSPQNASLLDVQYNEQARRVLSTVDSWSFDIFNFDKLIAGKSLFHLALHLFQDYGFLDIFNIDIIKLMRCLSSIEEGYHDSNPYHNSLHAADVTQAMHCYLREKELYNCVLPIEAMAALFASMMHDLDHPGVNQAYLIATTNVLASLYENSSVLENHHWRSAVGVLHECGIFDHFDAHQWGLLEWQLKSLILATDITRQQEFIRKFKEYQDDPNFTIKNNANHRHFVMQIAMKCADISNPCRLWPASKQWSEKICEEFFLQGDCERKLKLPITPMCDRYSTSMAKIQAGFMEHVVYPLFHEWRRFMRSELSKNMLENVKTNKNRWEKERAVELQKEAELNEEHTSGSLSSVFEQDELNEDSHVNGDTDNSESEEGDIIGETRFLSTLPSRHGSLDHSESLRSNSPTMENRENFVPGSRRHSLPLSYFRRESIRVTVRRESFPHVQRSRRNVPRNNFFHATSFEGFFPTTKKSISIESVLGRPKITTLSPSSEASRLASRLFSSDPHLAQRSQMPSANGQKAATRLTSLLALTAISPPAEIESCPFQAFQSRTVLAPLSGNAQETTGREWWQTRDPILNPLRRVSAIDFTFQIKGQVLGSHGDMSTTSQSKMVPDQTKADIIHVSHSEPTKLSERTRRRASDEESL
ncbi:high affinity cAMP-specific 3',5'-cyclic phosphodiesterase 7A isoform X2 [Octopus bimaculoides]|uniref:high affinity cAMP-specific 3',5'-cyclic phosphodiesterase 7A isoform X2 n=1 Tax=Octopus bimaculoides TaxID=37653 RepID=UPI0022E310C9|nr:high affinity cAMP-specific 3',5'-cyclic phosphodiesterase 7A isoform X2 [Octopus bimaculoides]